MKPHDGIPDAAEFGLLRAHLATLGISQAEITDAIGSDVSGRTRVEIADSLRTWLATGEDS